jgi:hypothetical protein
MPSPVLLLHRVLIEEYQSQGLQPPLPVEQLDEWRRKRQEELGPDAPREPEELERRLDSLLVQDFYAWLHRHGVQRSALCFSGGGIRSATFGLGIVQGLARQRLLRRFDFLSTVSGGGYLGSWLTAWIHRVRRQEPPLDPDAAIREVETAVGRSTGSLSIPKRRRSAICANTAATSALDSAYSPPTPGPWSR